jgi:hypothetical protein
MTETPEKRGRIYDFLFGGRVRFTISTGLFVVLVGAAILGLVKTLSSSDEGCVDYRR